MSEQHKIVIRLKTTPTTTMSILQPSEPTEIKVRSHPQLKLKEEEKLSNFPNESTLLVELSRLQILLSQQEALMGDRKPFEDCELVSSISSLKHLNLLKNPSQLYGQPPQYDPDFHGILISAKIQSRTICLSLFYLAFNRLDGHTRRKKLTYHMNKKFLDLKDKVRIINDKIDWLHWTLRLISMTPISVAMEGIRFIDNLIAKPNPKTKALSLVEN